jgi:excinuclease UvrABC helicase subunit UvrB
MYVHSQSRKQDDESNFGHKSTEHSTHTVQDAYPHLRISTAMEDAIAETYRRRAIQMAYNEKHGITPTTIISSIKDISVPRKKTEIFAG